MDTLDARIRYTIESGEPDSWRTYFAIDHSSGAVRQLMPVDTSIAKKFHLVIKVKFLWDFVLFSFLQCRVKANAYVHFDN